jgi:hypothetical protein
MSKSTRSCANPGAVAATSNAVANTHRFILEFPVIPWKLQSRQALPAIRGPSVMARPAGLAEL